MSSPDAMRSFFGTSGARPQEVYTPQVIKDGLDVLWPEGVALDPCHGPGSILDAERTLCTPPTLRGKRQVFEGPAEQNGLIQPWVPRTYVNPPFSLLEAWLEKARLEYFSRGVGEILVLSPVRTSRPWFRTALALCSDAYWLNYNIRFLGFKDAFPQALCLLYWGERSLSPAFDHIGVRAERR